MLKIIQFKLLEVIVVVNWGVSDVQVFNKVVGVVVVYLLCVFEVVVFYEKGGKVVKVGEEVVSENVIDCFCEVLKMFKLKKSKLKMGFFL